MRSPSFATLFTAIAVPVAAAQHITVATGTPVPRASATVFTCVDNRSLTPGVVGAPTVLRATAPCSYFGEIATSTLTVTPDVREARVVADALSFTASAVPAMAAVDGALAIDVVGVTQGTLIVDYLVTTTTTPTGAEALRVDVGADGTPELVLNDGAPAQGRFSMPLNVAVSIRTAIQFAAAVQGRNPQNGLAHHTTIDVTLRFVPQDTITFDATLAGCGPPGAPPPALTGTDTRTPSGHRIDLALDRGIPSAFAAFVFATRTASLPIALPPGCTFHVDPETWAFAPTDAVGHAGFAIGLPATLPPGMLHLQAVTFDLGPQAWASHRVDATLWP